MAYKSFIPLGSTKIAGTGFLPTAFQIAANQGNLNQAPTFSILPDVLAGSFDILFPIKGLYSEGTLFSIDVFPTPPGQGFGVPYTAPINQSAYEFAKGFGLLALGVNNLTQELTFTSTHVVITLIASVSATDVSYNNVVFTPA